ncbi:MAG: MBL fold metallo-hydrolase, partial [Proteobacteria bacterium]|nr:MBL fold metallo-hydrolase [Pseudomonadota bacterium]
MYKTFYIFLLFTTGFLFAEYKNTNGVASDKSFGDMLQWIRSDIEPEITKIELSSDWQKLNLSEDDNYAIWIGHSTFLIKKNGVTILTDPIFSKRASPFRNIGPKRLIPPAIPLDA